jgi:hypothetical protein
MPRAYGPGYPSSPPHAGAYGPRPHAGTSKPWWILVVAVMVLGVVAPYAYSLVVIRNATNPDNIATNVEREVLKQPRPPCPALEQCSVTTEEHDLTYTTCTKRLASSLVYRPGEMVLAGKDTRIAILTADRPGRRHTARFLSAQQEVELGDDEIIGRLCKPGPQGP